jgi:hypothetical protein
MESFGLGSFLPFLLAPYELRLRAEVVFFERALDPFGFALICRLFRRSSRPKIGTHFSGMCNFLLKMRPRQAAREIAWRGERSPGQDKPACGVHQSNSTAALKSWNVPARIRPAPVRAQRCLYETRLTPVIEPSVSGSGW